MEVIEELVDQLCPKDCIYRVPLTPTTDLRHGICKKTRYREVEIDDE